MHSAPARYAVHRSSPRRRPVPASVACEHRGEYDRDGGREFDGREREDRELGDRELGDRELGDRELEGPVTQPDIGLRAQVRGLGAQARRVLAATVAAGVEGGELGALADLARVADVVQAAMTALTARAEEQMLAQRRAGLPLVEFLGIGTRMTHGERRGLVRTAAGLARMPALRAASEAGAVGAGEVRAVLAETRRLDAAARAEIDALFADPARVAEVPVDTVLDEVAGRVVLHEERKADDDHVRSFERRFLAVQPGLDGTLAGYFEIDDQSGSVLLRALDDAAVPVTGDRAVTRDAMVGAAEVEPDRRTLGRRRADALVSLAEHWLADGVSSSGDERPTVSNSDPGRSSGRDRPDPAALPGLPDVPGLPGLPGSPGLATRSARSARPLVYVWTDIGTLVGDGSAPTPARILWDTLGPRPVLTRAALTRFASDARLQFILVDGGQVLGVAAPVATIPAKVRTAVHARDHGCRFPGCRVPARQTDLHHVVARAERGHTVVDNVTNSQCACCGPSVDSG